MLKVYGSSLCPDCRASERNFDRYGIERTFCDITKDLRCLKEFLKLRDENEAFRNVRGSGSIGIPALLLEDGTVTLDWEGYLKDQGLEPLQEEQAPACILDHPGNC